MDTRFPCDCASAQKPADGKCRIVFTGNVSVTKGIPVLLDAFRRFEDPQAILTLVGGRDRAARRLLERRMHADPRIRLAPGDPLPHLHAADVYVHPSLGRRLRPRRPRRWRAACR